MRNDACGLPLKKEKTMMLRKTQNQNDADDANDAESGIWYRDILKTASLASSASFWFCVFRSIIIFVSSSSKLQASFHYKRDGGDDGDGVSGIG